MEQANSRTAALARRYELEGESVMKLDDVKRNSMQRRTASRGTFWGYCKLCGNGCDSLPYTNTHQDSDTVGRVCVQCVAKKLKSPNGIYSAVPVLVTNKLNPWIDERLTGEQMTVLKVPACGPIALELSADAIASALGLDEWWVEVVSLPEELRGLDLRELAVHSPCLKTLPDWLGSLITLELFEVNNLAGYYVMRGGEHDSESTGPKTLPESIGDLANLRVLILRNLVEFNERSLPASMGKLTALETLHLENIDVVIPEAMGNLTALKKLLIVRENEFSGESDDHDRLKQRFDLVRSLSILTCLSELHLNTDVLDAPFTWDNDFAVRKCNLRGYQCLLSLTKLESLHITIRHSYDALQLPRAWFFSLSALTSLKLLESPWARQGDNYNDLKELPAVVGNLSILTVDGCGSGWPKLSLSVIGSLSALTVLRLSYLNNLKELPSAVESLSKLSILDIFRCNLQVIPKSVANLSALKVIKLIQCRNLLPSSCRNVSGCTTLESLLIYCSGWWQTLPVCPGLTRLHISKLPYERQHANAVFGIALALRSWPPPLLLDFDDYNDWSRTDCISLNTAIPLQHLGLPEKAKWWDNRTILFHFRQQQQKLLAFASGMQKRLGAESRASSVDDEMLRLIADEVLGRTLFKNWNEGQFCVNEEEEEPEEWPW